MLLSKLAYKRIKAENSFDFKGLTAAIIVEYHLKALNINPYTQTKACQNFTWIWK